MRQIVLWGVEHLDYGHVASDGIEGIAGLAITAGWLPTRYEKLEGDEDAVAVQVDGRRARLVLGDGHQGFSTTRAAIETVLAMPDASIAGAMRAADLAAIEADQRSTRQRDDADHRRRRGLYLWRARASTLTALGERRWNRFAGYGDTGWVPADEAMSADVEEVEPGDVVVAVSDGFTDVAGERDVAGVAAKFGRDPRAAAVALVERAKREEPGDNVAVAVLRIGMS